MLRKLLVNRGGITCHVFVHATLIDSTGMEVSDVTRNIMKCSGEWNYPNKELKWHIEAKLSLHMCLINTSHHLSCEYICGW